MVAGTVEGHLESATDLATLLSVLTLREKDPSQQRVICEASENGLKFTAQSAGKDVAVLGWIFKDAFTQYTFDGAGEEHLFFKLPVAPLLSCLTIFERANLTLKFPPSAHELRLSLEEDGAITECCLKTLLLDEAARVPLSVFLQPSERPLGAFKAKPAEVWHGALSEFQELEGSDVVLKVTLRAKGETEMAPMALRANTINSDANVELPQSSLEEVELAENAGELTYSYLLSSALAGCLKASKESRAVKIRFNREGVMSNQFILRSRGRQLLCEALVCPIAPEVERSWADRAQLRASATLAEESIGAPASVSAKAAEVAEADVVQVGQLKIFLPGAEVTHSHDPHETEELVLRLVNLGPFGSGQHPTTFLMLKAMQEMTWAGLSMCDYGCGSGVLGLLALRLGAKRCLGVDNVPDALLAAQDNARANECLERFELHLPPAEVLDKDLDFYTREGDWRSSTIAWTPLIPEEVDVVLANIVVGPLCRSAKMVGQLLRPDGQVLLAGMKEFQVKQVEEARRGSLQEGIIQFISVQLRLANI
ncbi:unnamed protein product [Durusdinium trenchii]|uniref:ETFB lysine methyltransferase n=1 Tax=Durusdinium trenchii TaxID=1381693 RepID=A0ABP0MXA7_9DINO